MEDECMKSNIAFRIKVQEEKEILMGKIKQDLALTSNVQRRIAMIQAQKEQERLQEIAQNQKRLREKWAKITND